MVYTLEDEEDEFTIRIEKDEFIVEGPAVEWLMRRINVGDRESIGFMQKMLKKLGIEDALKEKGICEGDTVNLDGYIFEWYE